MFVPSQLSFPAASRGASGTAAGRGERQWDKGHQRAAERYQKVMLAGGLRIVEMIAYHRNDNTIQGIASGVTDAAYMDISTLFE